MLYAFIKLLVKISVRVYFKTVHVAHSELIPQNAPLIIVANHPSSFMDPLVIASLLKRKIHFLARGDMFLIPVVGWIFRRFSMIPIFRNRDTPGAGKMNLDVFEECYQLMADKKVFIIFPEGFTVTERRLREVKKGPARIALGAEAAHNYKLGVKMLPVGLNYSNPHHFRSELLVKIGKPIEILDFADLHRQNQAKANRALTLHIKERLEELSLVIENEQLDEFVGHIETIYRSELRKEYKDPSAAGQDFIIAEDIAKAVQYFHKHEPARVKNVMRKMLEYTDTLKGLKLKDKAVKRSLQGKGGILAGLKTLLYILLGFPIWLFGALNNYIPFMIPAFFATKYVKRVAHHGSIFFTMGVFTFLVFYTSQIILAAIFINIWWIPVVYAVSLPFTGFFAFHYWKRLMRLRRDWTLISLFNHKKIVAMNLLKQREEILTELNKAKNDFIRITEERDRQETN